MQEASGGSESQYLLFVGFSGLDTSVVPQFAAWGLLGQNCGVVAQAR